MKYKSLLFFTLFLTYYDANAQNRGKGVSLKVFIIYLSRLLLIIQLIYIIIISICSSKRKSVILKT